MKRLPRPTDFEVRVANHRTLVPTVASLTLAGLALAVTLDVESPSTDLAQTLGTVAIAGLLMSLLLGFEGGVVAATVTGLAAAMAMAGGAEEVAIIHLTAVGVLWFLAADGAIASIELRTAEQLPRSLVWPFLVDRMVVAVGALGMGGAGGLVAGWGPGRSSVSAITGTAVVLVIVALVARRQPPAEA
ncbi:MAG: hypothetical protein GY929_23805 [Actinomycetia bacterium]|nr:hypothetical protein [Actinomycetes bacterium]